MKFHRVLCVVACLAFGASLSSVAHASGRRAMIAGSVATALPMDTATSLRHADPLPLVTIPEGITEVAGAWEWLTSPPRTQASAFVDHARDRMIILGGRDGAAFRNDLWELSLSDPDRLRSLPAVGVPPSPRCLFTAVFDPRRNRIVVFGGNSGYRAVNDVWALDLSDPPRWTELHPSGPQPDKRFSHAAIFDPVRDRMIVTGGTNLDVGTLNDIWELSFSGAPAWRQLSPPSMPSPPRNGATAIYDPSHARMVLFGGHNFEGGIPHDFNDVWAFDLGGGGSWAPVLPAGVPPSVRANMSSVLDPTTGDMLVFGGYSYVTSQIYEGDAWRLALSGTPKWSKVAATGNGPDARLGSTMVLDEVRHRVLIAGGNGRTSTFSDVWSLPLAASPEWRRLLPIEDMPTARTEHTAVLDSMGHRLLVFGGGTQDGTTFTFQDSGLSNDTWSLSLGHEPSWSRVVTTGPRPSPRSGHVAVWDQANRHMLVFGGNVGGAPSNDLWALDPSCSPCWQELQPEGAPPPPRADAIGTLDPLRRRLIVFGGRGAGNQNLGDLWELSLEGKPRWSLISPGGETPPSMAGHAAIYDPRRDRVIVFNTVDGKVWQLSLPDGSRWSHLETHGVPPQQVRGASAIYDQLRDRMVVFGGTPAVSGTWSLALGETPTWEVLQPAGSPPAPVIGHAATYDPDGDRMFIIGGYGSWAVDQTVALNWGSPLRRVAIDVRPGSDANPVNVKSRGVLPVAILGDADFSPDTLDFSSIRLDGAPAQSGSPQFRDTNQDGLADAVLHFDLDSLRFTDGVRFMSLSGRTRGGMRVMGVDSVETRPARPTVLDPLVAPAPAISLDLAVRDQPCRVLSGSIELSLALPHAALATIDMVDVAGRSLLRRRLGGLAAGRHSVELALPPGISAGVYFLRLQQSDHAVVSRLVLLH